LQLIQQADMRYEALQCNSYNTYLFVPTRHRRCFHICSPETNTRFLDTTSFHYVPVYTKDSYLSFIFGPI